MISSYSVADRTQIADVDPSMLIEELDEESKPCPICGEDDNEDVLLLCDGCDLGYHTYCVGLDSVPVGHWFCESCATQRAIEPVLPDQNRYHSHHSSHRRTRGQQRRVRNRNQASDSNWARVWQSVWDRLNIDLDFPFEDGPVQRGHDEPRFSTGSSAVRYQRALRTNTNHRRDYREWERRLQVADRQGSTNRFRETAPALLDLPDLPNLPISRPRPAPPEPESREEILAWNALEKAKDILSDPTPKRNNRKSTTSSPSDADPISRKRKRKSATNSPTDVPAPQLGRPLKRPQTRRAPNPTDFQCDSGAESSSSRRRTSAGSTISRRRRTPEAGTAVNGPSFLQLLLKEVESSAAPDESKGQARSPAVSTALAPLDHISPQNSSPGASPSTSNHPSPRALSTTPPPSFITRPGSPTPLTSKVEPIYPPLDFSLQRSPPSPSSSSNRPDDGVEICLRNRRQPRSLLPTGSEPSTFRSAETSPSRINMSLTAKSDVQKMVKDALKSPYMNNMVSKDEYTDINRNVSRMLYDKIGDSENLTSHGRETWQRMASEEVEKALQLLRQTSKT